MTLLDGLVAYWKLDEAFGAAIDAHGSQNLDDNGGVGSSETGKINGARSFGLNKYLSHADVAALSLSGTSFTIQAWVKMSSKAMFGLLNTVLSKWSAINSQCEYALYYEPEVDCFRFSVRSGETMTSVIGDELTNPPLDEWMLLHAWYDMESGELGISVNAGTPDVLAYASVINDGDSEFWIGGLSGFGELDEYWKGDIDEVAIWRRVLTSDERTMLLDLGYPFEPPPDVACFDLVLERDAFDVVLEPDGFELAIEQDHFDLELLEC